MADTAPNWKVGEIFADAKLHAVEYAGSIKAGDPLKISGGNDEGLVKVQKQSGQTLARYVAVYDGESGYKTDALFEGTTKIKAHVKWSAGGKISAHDGAFEAFNASQSADTPCGFGYKGVAANDDFTLVYFHGSVN